jgi:hypothetical protein
MSEPEQSVQSNQDIRKKQLRLFVIGFSGLGFLAIVLWLLGRETEPVAPTAQIQATAPVYDVTRAVDDKSYWVFKSEKKLAEQEQTQNKMLKEISEIREDLNKHSGGTKSKELEDMMKLFSDRIEHLEEKFQDKSSAKSTSQIDLSTNGDTEYLPKPEMLGAGNPSFNQSVPLPRTIFTETLSLDTLVDETKNIPHIDSYIPAGSYAKAVLLSGVDVSAFITIQPKACVIEIGG